METKNTQPIFPWYKERLQTKYLKAPTNKISFGNICWRSVNVSLDDFSDGSSAVFGARRGVSSVIFHGTPNQSSTQKPRKCISKEHACFSKQMIRKQIRREYVAAVEQNLKQHPLSMYPHYKDHVTAEVSGGDSSLDPQAVMCQNNELFDKVVSVLDPDMCMNSASSLPTPTAVHAKEEEENCTEPSKEDVNRAKQGKAANKINPDVQNPSPGNPYILQMHGNGLKKGQKIKANQLSKHDDMKTATKVFSKWFVFPDEEIVNITESATLGHFHSGLQHSSSSNFSI